MSAFSSKFPDGLQSLGLFVGLILAGVSFVSTIWHVLNERRIKQDKPRLILGPEQLVTVGVIVAMVGGVVALGGLIWQWNNQASGHSQLPKMSANLQPPLHVKMKDYFQAEKIELANILSDLSSHLSNDGLRAATSPWIRRLQTDRNNLQMQEYISDIESTKTQADRLRAWIWADLISNNKKYENELKAIVGDESGSDAPLAVFFGLVSQHLEMVKRFNKIQESAGDAKTFLAESVFHRDPIFVVQPAAEAVKAWIAECNAKIDEQREVLK